MDDEVSGQLIDYQSAKESEAEDITITGESQDEAITRKLSGRSKDALKEERRREELAAGVRREIDRRLSILADAYPFEVHEGSISFRGLAHRSCEAYIFCLTLAISPQAKDRDAFEDLVAETLKNYLGASSVSHSFGWKGLPEDERPKRIKQKINAIEALTGEWIWHPDDNFPDDPPAKLVKDLGLDVIAWIPVPDKRMGQVFLVAQCATGRTDWDDKLHDVCWSRIGHWVRPTPAKWSVRCFAIPFHIPNRGRLKEVSSQGGLFLDRARITLMLRH